MRGSRRSAAIVVVARGRVGCVVGRRQGVVELFVLGEMVRVMA